MATEIHYKNTFPEYYAMRNYNEDSNNNSWHLFNTLTNSHYYDGFTPRTASDAYLGHDKDELKQKMLQHETIFKNQVHELHRLYTRQRDMMEEVKKREFHKYQIPIDTSSSSSLIPSKKPYDKWQNPSLPFGNSKSRPSIFGADISDSPLSCSKENGLKDCEIVECRPTKVRKKLFDLQIGPHGYTEPHESEQFVDNQESEISSYKSKENGFVLRNGQKSFLDEGEKKDGYKNGQQFMQSNGLADLNEPLYVQEAKGLASVDFLGPSVKQEGFNRSSFEGKVNGKDWVSSCLREPGNNRSNMQHLHGKQIQHQGIYSEISSKIQDNSHFNQNPLPFSNPNGYLFINSSNTGNSWSPSGQPWVKSNDNFTRKLTSFQTHPSLLSSPKTHEGFRDKLYRNGNGFHNGSSSGSKELSGRLPSYGFDYLNCNKLDDGSQKIFKGSNFIDLTDTNKGLMMDLNTVQPLSNGDENSRKCDQTVASWLKSKPIISKNSDNLGSMKKEKDESLGTNYKKLLGIPIFGNFCVSKTDVSSSASKEHRGFDINVPWDDVDETCNEKTEEIGIEIKNFKNHFDLNSCVTEDDDLLVTESVKSSKKMRIEIDLEAPAVSEPEEETEPKPDYIENEEIEKLVAQAIVEISSQQVQVGPVEDDDNPLLWFIDVINNSYEKKTILSLTTRETDEYEMLTLQLEETKEEDYMSVPEFQEPDEVGPALTGRPRRGQSRRGRPRRDVLPGMTCLSRHEITEDLQIFGGLMKATGHSWNLGKKIGGRGRRKVKAVGLDERSLTGWGKTTRRPRRQRCGTVAVQLT